MKSRQCDFLIIGGGIAGLSFALSIAEKRPESSVFVLSKTVLDESNTTYAQGGIAAVLTGEDVSSGNDHDRTQNHIDDTLKAGHYKNRTSTVQRVIEAGEDSIKKLQQWGVEFDKDDTQHYVMSREGGHSHRRVLHHKDYTGKEIQRKLLLAAQSQPNIQLYPLHFATDLIVQKTDQSEECVGVSVLDVENRNELSYFFSPCTILATGGAGQVYATTTNPPVATADGIAMALRARVRAEGLSYVQFHPTAFYNKKSADVFLISEAVRGDGAILVDESGYPFMNQYHPMADLAPRDIVSRSILYHIQKTGAECAYLDTRMISKEHFLSTFPNIYEHCYKNGVDPFTQPIPVRPASHYICGGICVDDHGATSLKGLYALGECANTGLHGSNRLASNSLLEAVAYAIFTSEILVDVEVRNEGMNEYNATLIPYTDDKILEVEELIQRLRTTSDQYMGALKSNESIATAKRLYDEILREAEEKNILNLNHIKSQELRNLLAVGRYMAKEAAEATENTGVFYNQDLA